MIIGEYTKFDYGCFNCGEEVDCKRVEFEEGEEGEAEWYCEDCIYAMQWDLEKASKL